MARTNRVGEIEVEISADNRRLKQELKSSEREIRSFSGSLKGAFAAAGALIAVDQIAQIGKAVINTRAEFQRYEAVLTNTLGSNSSAQRALQQISDFVATTPFQIDEVTDAYTRLANRGVKLTTDQLTRLGDVATFLGKDFGQLNEAILDINNTERKYSCACIVRTMYENRVNSGKAA